jgi:NAD(P)H-dependent flavin oxidoreductase YrpB (nitropropane dioxygenase family)
VLKTPLCDTLGIDLPIWNAGMGGGGAGPALAAAVSNAGGLGVLGAGGLPAPLVRAQLDELKDLTDRPFAVNAILALLDEDHIQAALDAEADVLVLFWGDPSPYVQRAHAAGTKIALQVGSREEAEAAAEAGVDAIILQGVEAGGHVKATTALSASLPATVRAVDPVPVVASGGIADGRGLAAALSLGAQAVSMGTRFLCSDESPAYGPYKERIVAARGEDTVLTRLFDGGWPDAPHRALRNETVERWERAGRPAPGRRPGEGDVVATLSFGDVKVPLPRYHLALPIEGIEGDWEATCLHAGESCSLVDDIRPAGEIVAQIAAEAGAVLAARASA